MKTQFVKAAMLLLAMSIISTSCNKDENMSLTGIWLATDYILTEPGGTKTLPKDEYSERDFSEWSDATLKFDDAGKNTVWFYGISLLHYTRQGNKIIIDDDNSTYLSGQTLTITGGRIITEPFISKRMSLIFEKQ